LIMVLSFFLIISGIVTEEFWSVRQAEILSNKIYLKEQAYVQAVSAFESYLKFFKNDGTSYDTLNDIWAYPLEIPLPEGKITISIVDEERFLNLNIVKDKEGEEIVRRLFDILKIRSLSTDDLKVWVCGGFWSREEEPKKAALDSLEELLYLGMNEEDFYGKVENWEFFPGIKEMATVWSNGRVNINTAPLQVIMALSPDIDESLAQSLIEYRKEHPFKKPEDILMVEGFTFEIWHKIKKWITVKSENFRINISVKVGGVEGELVVIVKREGGKFKVRYWRFS